VVGDLLVDRRDRGELAVGDKPGQQLGVVHDLVVAAELGVLVRDRVEAVRAARHDLAGAGLVQRLDVLLGQHREHELVAHPPGRVAGARLGRVRGRRSSRPRCAAAPRSPWWSSWPGPPAPPRSRPRRGTPPRRRSGRPRPGRRSRARSSTRSASTRPCPTGRPCSPGSSASRTPRPGTRTRSAPGAGACRDVVDVLDVDRALLTQAPQLVQDQSTSGSMTPLDAESPTSGRSASAF
jgi:hypothetical protein